MRAETLLCWASVNYLRHVGPDRSAGGLGGASPLYRAGTTAGVGRARCPRRPATAPADRDYCAPCHQPYRPCRALPDPTGGAYATDLGTAETAACECLARHAKNGALPTPKHDNVDIVIRRL